MLYQTFRHVSKKNTSAKAALTFLLTIFIIVLTLTGCQSNNKTVYTATENTELGVIELNRDGITYRPFGIFGNTKFKGKQIGIHENEPNAKICEVKGYPPDEWIVEYHDVFMGGDMLFKAVGVTNIPTELAQYRKYDYD